MKAKVILHPILFAIFPVLFAYVHNMDFAPPGGEIMMLLLLFACSAAVLWAALAYATRDWQKAAIGVSLFIILFFSSGHLTNLIAMPLWNFQFLSIHVGHLKVLAGVWIVVAVTAGPWLKKASRDAVRTATRALNLASVALVLLGILNLTTTSYASSHEQAGRRRVPSTVADSPNQAVAGNRDLPDIYYIILDAYGRSDTLEELYHYDNTPFLDALRAKGFYVAEQSQSNYSQTMLSLASSLNSEYLETPRLMSAASTGSNPSFHVALNSAAAHYFNTTLTNNRQPLAHMIQYSRAAEALKTLGYRFVAFTSGYGGVQLPNADVVMHAHVVDDFEESLIGTTPIPDLLERLYDPLDLHRQRVQYVFDHLADRMSAGAPAFVFAHILCPHIPFAFEADGTPVHVDVSKPQIIFQDSLAAAGERNREAMVKAYRGQVQFVNRRIEAAIDAILARSTRPPIIILQSDHGPQMTLDPLHPSPEGLRERMSILNAYYVPSEMRARLYPQISPVNTFRIILGQYFSGKWGLLPDESYFSTWDSPYAFSPVKRQDLSTP